MPGSHLVLQQKNGPVSNFSAIPPRARTKENDVDSRGFSKTLTHSSNAPTVKFPESKKIDASNVRMAPQRIHNEDDDEGELLTPVAIFSPPRSVVPKKTGEGGATGPTIRTFSVLPPIQTPAGSVHDAANKQRANGILLNPKTPIAPSNLPATQGAELSLEEKLPGSDELNQWVENFTKGVNDYRRKLEKHKSLDKEIDKFVLTKHDAIQQEGDARYKLEQHKSLDKEIEKFVLTKHDAIQQEGDARYKDLINRKAHLHIKKADLAKKTVVEVKTELASKIAELDEKMAREKALLDSNKSNPKEIKKALARFVKAKTQKLELQELHHFASAERLIAASKAAHEARNSAFKIAHYYRQQLLIINKQESQQRGVYRLLKNEDSGEIERKRYFAEAEKNASLMGIGLDAIEKNYLGLASAESLAAHVTFESRNTLAPLLSNLVSGAAVELKDAIGLKGGGGVGNVGMAKATLTGGVGLSKKIEYSIDNDTDINYIRQYWVDLSINAKLKFGPGFANLMLGVGVPLRADYFEEDGTRVGVERSILYAARRENDLNWIIKGGLRTNGVVRKVYSAGRQFTNLLRRVCNRPERNPRLGFYATTTNLANAHGTQALLNSLSQRMEWAIEKPRFSRELQGVRSVDDMEKKLNEALPLSQPAVRSQVNAPEPTEYALVGGKSSLTGNVGVASPQGDGAGAGFIPTAKATAEGKLESNATKLNLQKMEFTHQTISNKRTSSTKSGRQLADEILTKIWDKKSNGQRSNLPVGLKQAREIYARPTSKVKNPQDAVALIKEFADTAQLLEGRLADFKKDAALFIQATANAGKGGSSEEAYLHTLYAELSEKLKKHQYLADRLKDGEKFSETGARYAVLRVLASYDTAAGLLDLGIESLIGQLPKDVLQNSDVQKALAEFDSAYSKYTQQVTNANYYAPFTKEQLARASELHSITDGASAVGKASAKLEAGVTLPTVLAGTSVTTANTYKSDGTLNVAQGTYAADQRLFLGGNVRGETAVSKRISHPNPWRLGTFFTNEVSASVIPGGLGSLFTSNVAKKVYGTVKDKVKVHEKVPKAPSFLSQVGHVEAPEKGNDATELALHALGLQSTTASLKVSEGRRNGYQQYRRIVSASTSSSAFETPDLLTAQGGSLTASFSSDHTVTKALTLIGPDLPYNALQYLHITQNGIDGKKITSFDQVLTALRRPFNTDPKELKASLNPLIENMGKDRSFSLAYFGWNAIDGVLNQFTQADLFGKTAHTSMGNLALEDGFEVYRQDVRKEFSRMTGEMNKTVEKRQVARDRINKAEKHLREISANGMPEKETIAAEKELLEAQEAYQHLFKPSSSYSDANAPITGTLSFNELQKLQGQIRTSLDTQLTDVLSSDDLLMKRFKDSKNLTVAEFLALATPQEKKVFYQEREMGLRLFSSYLILVGDAQKVGDTYKTTIAYQRPVSLFSQENATESGNPPLSHRFRNQIKNLGDRTYHLSRVIKAVEKIGV